MALLDLATGSLVADPADAATELEPNAGGAALAAAAGGNAGPIAIRFPVFNDGRGISLAVLLRERHGFKDEIRAVGHLIPDLAQFLLLLSAQRRGGAARDCGTLADNCA